MYNRQEKSKNPKFSYPNIEKNVEKSAILYNWITADRNEAGFSGKKLFKNID